MKRVLLAASIAALLSTTTLAAEAPQDFVNKAITGSLFEVEASKLAPGMSWNEDVKAFALQMVMDHSKAKARLEDVARAAGLSVPASLDAEKQAELEKLKQAAKNFDPLYIEAQIKSHEAAVAMFEDYAKNGTDPALKDFADKTLPTLRQHLDQIKRVNIGLDTEQQPKPVQTVE